MINLKQFFSFFIKSTTDYDLLLKNNEKILLDNQNLKNLNNNLKSENEFLLKQIQDLSNEDNLIFPVANGKILISETYILLNNLGIGNISLSDEYFNLCSVEEARTFTESTAVQKRKWEEENHDCDNFSFALLGYWSTGLKSFAFGYARSTSHAYNIMIDNNKEVWICEPQTNEWIKYKENKDAKYKTIQVIM
jgi:hypothetical protein